MRTIATTATIQEDGTLTVRVPTDIDPGSHRIVVVIEETSPPAPAPLPAWPSREYGPWPAELSLRREDLSDAWGR